MTLKKKSNNSDCKECVLFGLKHKIKHARLAVDLQKKT